MRDGKLRDSLIVLAVVLPLGAAWGALLGWSANRFGVSSGVRLLLLGGFVAVISGCSGTWVKRRAQARQGRRA
jgi:hypothetical protein